MSCELWAKTRAELFDDLRLGAVRLPGLMAHGAQPTTLLRLLQSCDQFLGEIFFRLRPQDPSTNGTMLLDRIREAHQLGNIVAKVLLDSRRQPLAFLDERGVEPEVHFDVTVVGVDAVIELDSVHQELYGRGPLHPALPVLVIVRDPEVPEGLEDKGKVVVD